MKVLKSFLVLVLCIGVFYGCAQDVDVASHNLSYEADNFNLQRRVVFYNGITGEYMLVVEGLCSIEYDSMDKQLELTCKTGPDTYKKHFLGLSDNVTYFVEQLEPKAVDKYHYKVMFKPASILPDIDVKL